MDPRPLFPTFAGPSPAWPGLCSDSVPTFLDFEWSPMTQAIQCIRHSSWNPT